MNKLRLAVVGTGLAFMDLHLPVFTELHERFEIVGVYNRTISHSEDAAKKIADLTGVLPTVYHTLENLLTQKSIEAVDVAVPIHVTAEICKQVLLSGKHVFAEKPLADNLPEGIALLNLAKSKGLTIAVGENFRYQDKFYQVRRLVDTGVIGKPILYRLNDMHYTPPEGKYAVTEWRKEGKHKGGYLIDGGTHIIAGMRALVGNPVTQVQGLSTSFQPSWLGNQDDTLLLQLRFENGLIGQVALGYGSVDHEARNPKIYGQSGTMTLYKDRIEIWPNDPLKPITKVPIEKNNSGFSEEWLDFWVAVKESKPLFGTPEDFLLDLQIILSGLLSASNGKVIKQVDRLGEPFKSN